MRKGRSILLNVALGFLTCLFLVGVVSPSFSKTAPTASEPAVIQQSLESNLAQAKAVLMAQDSSTAPSTSTFKSYVAVLQTKPVVPTPSSNNSFASSGAVLVGNRFIVRGDYSNLTSSLRDYATDPLNPPNPNITSGIHMHRGEPGKNGPFQQALTVEPSGDRSGRFRGDYTLTDEQLQALSAGNLYVDLHTKQNRGGELRGAFKPF